MGPSVLRLADFVNGYPYKPEQLGDDGTPVVRIRQMLDRSADVQLAHPPSNAVWIDSGDLLFSWSGTLAVRIWDLGPALLNQHLFRVDPKPGVDRRWLSFVLEVGLGKLRPLMHGSAMTHITRDMLRSLTVALPSPNDQRAIADYLDTETARIDALIAKKRRMVELLNERFRSYRTSELLRGLDPITGKGLLPAGWSNVSLGVCVQLQRGHDLPDQRRVAGEVPIISSGGVSGWHTEAAAHGPGVVTGRYGTIGDAYFVDGPYWPLNTTLYVRDFRSNDPRWVLHVLSTLPLDSESAKSAVTGINRNVIGRLRVARPPTAEQRAIAGRVDEAKAKVDDAGAALNRQIDLLVEHRQALITAAVTGELSVPGVAA